MKIERVSPHYVFARPEFDRLCRQYTEESGVKLWGGSKVCIEDYRDTKMLAVFNGEAMVGFACLRLTKHPHYVDKIISSLDAVYIEPSARKGRAGVQLINEVKALAASLGADTMLMSAPYGSRLSRLLRFILKGDPVSEVFCVGTGKPNTGGN